MMDSQSGRCSPAATDSTSESNPSADAPCGRARTIATAGCSSRTGGPVWTCCLTCERSTREFLESTCSSVASLARTSPPLAAALESLTEQDPGSGSLMPTPFAFFDRESLSWRTSSVYSSEDSGSFSVIWPKQGMTRDGLSFALPTLEDATDALAYSWLLPTPRVSSTRSSRSAMTRKHWSAPSLSQILEMLEGILPREFDSWDEVPGKSRQLLPTPMSNGKNPGSGGELRAAITHGPTRRNGTGMDSWGRPNAGRPPKLLPTPGANDSTGSELDTRKGRQETGKTGGHSLRDLPKLLPTPTSTDHKGSDMPSRQGPSSLREVDKLLPTPVVTQGRTTDKTRAPLPGASTPEPSTDGPTSSDGHHPDQLTIGDV